MVKEVLWGVGVALLVLGVVTGSFFCIRAGVRADRAYQEHFGAHCHYTGATRDDLTFVPVNDMLIPIYDTHYQYKCDDGTQGWR